MNLQSLERELRRIVLSLRTAQTSVYIGFVLVNDAEHQQRIQREIDQRVAPELGSYTVDLSISPLGKRVSISPRANVVTHLVGLYDRPREEQHNILQSLNRAREYLGHAGGPVLIWLTPEQMIDVTEYAADVWAWRGGVYDFSQLADMPVVTESGVLGNLVTEHYNYGSVIVKEHRMDKPIADYRNPYDFVPLEGTPSPPVKPDQSLISGYGGTLSFTLEVLTPLCIHHDPGKPNQQGHHAFAHLNNTPTIPATSLKGMLRSVHEVVTNSTMGMLKSGQKGWYRQRVPPAYHPGENTNNLTLTEALFGMVGGKGDDSVGYAGRIFLDDIPIPQTIPLKPQRVSRPRGGMPKPEHESFYFERERNGNILGRKFYYHQQDYRRVAQVYAQGRGMSEITVLSVPEGTRLRGSLRFCSLNRDELCSLVYALVLEDHLAHKLGYGKPLGLGSVRLHITRLEVERTEGNVPSRLLSYGDPDREDWTDRVPALRDAARNAWLKRERGNQSYAAFATIARWPQTENFIYPNFDFFQAERGKTKKTTLWAYQGRTTMHPSSPITPPASPTARTIPSKGAAQQPAPEPTLPAPSVEQRRTGTLEHKGDKYFVRDDASKNLYECLWGLQKNIRKRINQGETLRVSFLPKYGGVLGAQDITLLEGDA